MASFGWLRDLLMAAFTLLLLAIAGLLLSGSNFAVIPIGGDRSLMPMSLIIVATITMMWTLRHWTDMSRRRALFSLVISLSTTRVIAVACLEGIARRDGVFLRTSKAGDNKHRIRKALRLSRWETLLACALYAAAGLLATLRNPPLLLIGIVSLQGTVYLCGPIAALWNLRAQRVPAAEYRRRFHEQRLRTATRRRVWAKIPTIATASLLTLGAGGLAAALLSPATLLRASAVVKTRLSPQALLSSSEGYSVYLRFGAGRSASGPLYYPVSSVVLSQQSLGAPGVSSLSFDTSSPDLLSQIVHEGGQATTASPLAIVVRRPGSDGRRATTELTDTFARALVSSFEETLSPLPTGEVTVSLIGSGHLLTSPKAIANLGPFTSTAPSKANTTEAYLSIGPPSHTQSYAMITSVELSQLPGVSPQLTMSFDTSSSGLLDDVLRDGGSGKQISGLSLAVVKAGGAVRSATAEIAESFYSATVTSFDENLTGSPSGKVTLSLVKARPHASRSAHPAGAQRGSHGSTRPAHSESRSVVPTSRQ